VFGKVIEGMEVVEAIASSPTGTVDMHQDVPVTPVIINSARRADDVPVEPPTPQSGD
jgi:peptidyl-prolyl cis-trans isomerase A (cyclophilin A)